MGVFDSDLSAKRPEEERNGPQLLDDIAELTRVAVVVAAGEVVRNDR